MNATSRVDLHCHSTASVASKLGVQRSLGLPECATPPEDVLELATGRGMDFVTLTDHDAIDGAQSIADDPRVFLSEELTVHFAGEPQAVHVLCLGITPDDHAWLQHHNGDVEACAAYLHEHEIACALAHPFYPVAAPLTPRHRRRLAELFPVWETRNGSRAAELNAPAAVYIETHGGTGVGGSDDHAGVDIGRTWTQTPAAATPAAFLAHLRAGRAEAGGEQGSAEKWAHAALGLATRALGRTKLDRDVDPLSVLTIVQRLVGQGGERGGADVAELCPDDARLLLDAWLTSVGLDLDGPALLAYLQDDGFTHRGLLRKARAAHERALAEAVPAVAAQLGAAEPDLGAAARTLFEAVLPAVPYLPAAAFLGRETAGLSKTIGAARRHAGATPRKVALITDGIGSVHGVSRTIEELRARDVPGFDVEVIGTDAAVDRRLGSVAEVDVPSYEGLSLGVPSLPRLVETLADGRYDLVHVTAPGPSGIAALGIAKLLGLPVVGSYHTELAQYAGVRSGDPRVELYAGVAVSAFYRACDLVLSPSPVTDEALEALGIAGDLVGRWDRGVDPVRFGPHRRDPKRLPGAVTVLYAGRLAAEKGMDVLADTILEANAIDPRIHLVVAGGGPEHAALVERLGPRVTCLGWLDGLELATAYASADMLLFPSRTDTFGQVVLEAQASGLPVVAVGEGGPAWLVRDGVSGLLREPDAGQLAQAVLAVAGDPDLARRLRAGGLASAGERTWDRAFGRLADGYARALHGAATDEGWLEAARAAA